MTEQAGARNYEGWSPDQLIEALEESRRQVAALQAANEEYRWLEEALKKRTRELNERVKELDVLYAIATLFSRADLGYDARLQSIADLLPSAWQHPSLIGCRIVLDGREYRSGAFVETPYSQRCSIVRHRKPSGCLQVCYKKPPPPGSPFLREEQWLLKAVASWLADIGERGPSASS